MKGPIKSLVARLQGLVRSLRVRAPFFISYDSTRVPRGRRPEEYSSREEYRKETREFTEVRLKEWERGLTKEEREALSQGEGPLLVMIGPKKSASAESWIEECLSDSLASYEAVKKRKEEDNEGE